jgi:hypothetical protein
VFMSDASSRGLVLISGMDGVYAYDGDHVALLRGSSPKDIGDEAWITELPSIDKVMISTRKGLFELDRDLRIHPVRLPPEISPGSAMTDFPPGRIAVIGTAHNMYSMTRTERIDPIPGAAGEDYPAGRPFIGVPPGRDVMAIIGDRELHVLAMQPDCPMGAERGPG